jgi:hypothetical protein
MSLMNPSEFQFAHLPSPFSQMGTQLLESLLPFGRNGEPKHSVNGSHDIPLALDFVTNHRIGSSILLMARKCSEYLELPILQAWTAGGNFPRCDTMVVGKMVYIDNRHLHPIPISVSYADYKRLRIMAHAPSNLRLLVQPYFLQVSIRRCRARNL